MIQEGGSTTHKMWMSDGGKAFRRTPNTEHRRSNLSCREVDVSEET